MGKEVDEGGEGGGCTWGRRWMKVGRRWMKVGKEVDEGGEEVDEGGEGGG